ncbi:Uncharacterised protein [uncultured archaeon]|nr:Uncharacterised protein [uncultured archaeon]
MNLPTSDPAVLAAAAAIIAATAAIWLLWTLTKKILEKLLILLLNSLLGLGALLILVYGLKIPIPINPATIIVVGLFGTAGLGALILLTILGIL